MARRSKESRIQELRQSLATSLDFLRMAGSVKGGRWLPTRQGVSDQFAQHVAEHLTNAEAVLWDRASVARTKFTTADAVRAYVYQSDGEFTGDDVVSARRPTDPEISHTALRAELVRLFRVGLLSRRVRPDFKGREYIYRRTPLAMTQPDLILKAVRA